MKISNDTAILLKERADVKLYGTEIDVCQVIVSSYFESIIHKFDKDDPETWPEDEEKPYFIIEQDGDEICFATAYFSRDGTYGCWPVRKEKFTWTYTNSGEQGEDYPITPYGCSITHYIDPNDIFAEQDVREGEG